MTRHHELLMKAAEALDETRSPLDTDFLIDNEVTADEAIDLAQQLAIGVRLLIHVVSIPGYIPILAEVLAKEVIDK